MESNGENPLLDSRFPDVSGKGRGYQLQSYTQGHEDWSALRKVSVWQTITALEKEFRDRAAQMAEAKRKTTSVDSSSKDFDISDVDDLEKSSRKDDKSFDDNDSKRMTNNNPETDMRADEKNTSSDHELGSSKGVSSRLTAAQIDSTISLDRDHDHNDNPLRRKSYSTSPNTQCGLVDDDNRSYLDAISNDIQSPHKYIKSKLMDSPTSTSTSLSGNTQGSATAQVQNSAFPILKSSNVASAANNNRRLSALPHHIPKNDGLSKRLDDIRKTMGDEVRYYFCFLIALLSSLLIMIPVIVGNEGTLGCERKAIGIDSTARKHWLW